MPAAVGPGEMKKHLLLLSELLPDWLNFHRVCPTPTSSWTRLLTWPAALHVWPKLRRVCEPSSHQTNTNLEALWPEPTPGCFSL